jgi:hypothetical protein
MGLNAWERQALDSIENGIARSDPELTALLSVFTGLVSGEKMPDREKVTASLRRLRRARWRSAFRRAYQRLGLPRAVLLSLLTVMAATLIAVPLIVSSGGGHGGTCTVTAAMGCPAPGQSPSSSPHGTTTGQAPQQQPATVLPQAGP